MQKEEIIEIDPLLIDAIEFTLTREAISASLLQRKFKIGYSRAGRLVEQMEQLKIIGKYVDFKPRKVIISLEDWKKLKPLIEIKSSTENLNNTNLNKVLSLEEKITISEQNLHTLFTQILQYKNIDVSYVLNDLSSLKELVIKHYPQYTNSISFLDSNTTKEDKLTLLESTYAYINNTYKIEYVK